MKQQMANLQSQIRGLEEFKGKLYEKLKRTNALRDETERELATAREAASNLVAEKEEIASKYTACQPQIQAARASLEQAKTACDEAQLETKRLTSAVSLLQQSFETQKLQTSETYAQRDKLLTLAHKQDTVLKLLEQNCFSLKGEKKKMARELATFRSQPEQVIDTVIEEIPHTSWLCPEFPTELHNQIMELNRSMPITAKVKHSLLTIARFYNAKISDLSKRNEKNQAAAKSRASRAGPTSSTGLSPSFSGISGRWGLLRPEEEVERVSKVRVALRQHVRRDVAVDPVSVAKPAISPSWFILQQDSMSDDHNRRLFRQIDRIKRRFVSGNLRN
jgi:chromosome segregation ATPase